MVEKDDVAIYGHVFTEIYGKETMHIINYCGLVAI